MYSIVPSNSFKKDLKLIEKRKYDLVLLKEVIVMIEADLEMPAKYKLHTLKGNFKGCFECHIKPDWLLIWMKDEHNLEITLIRTGTHSDIFG